MLARVSEDWGGRQEKNAAVKSELIDRPIFIFGTGRGGTTIFLRLLGSHPDLTWISNYTNHYPRLPQLAGLSRVLDVPLLWRLHGQNWRVTPKPVEPITAFNLLTNNVFSAPRELSESDVDKISADRFRSFVLSHLRWQGKRRFITKHTGFPRIRFLKSIFPEAIFLHVMRDGRAVASSLLRMRWWDGTMKSWWWGAMREDFAEEYAKSRQSPVVLAAIVWKTLLDQAFQESAHLQEDEVMHIRYDNLIANHQETMCEVAEFCGLESGHRFRRRLSSFQISRSDNRWKSDLTSQEIELLEGSLSEYLQKYGFAHT